MDKKNKIRVYDMVVVALMAAVVYVVTNFRINIPMPIGNAMIHFGNVFCLLAGLMLGGKRGGLAAGIGSMFFDLFSDWATSAPFTLVFKFIMAYLCGKIAYSGGAEAKSFKRNIIGAMCGSAAYTFLFVGKNFITGLFFLRNPLETVLIDALYRGGLSLFNAAIAVGVSVVLAPVLRAALERSGIYGKLWPVAHGSN